MNIRETGSRGLRGATSATALVDAMHGIKTDARESGFASAQGVDAAAQELATLRRPAPPAAFGEGSVEQDEILFRRKKNKRRRAAKAAKLARRRNRK